MTGSTPRDTTVAGLIAKLQELVEINPEIAGWEVVLEGDGSWNPWKGTTWQHQDDRLLELEAPS